MLINISKVSLMNIKTILFSIVIVFVAQLVIVSNALADDGNGGLNGSYVGYVTTSNGLAALTLNKDGTFFLNSTLAPNLLYRYDCMGTWEKSKGNANANQKMINFICYRPQQAQPDSNACGSLGNFCIAVVKGTAVIDNAGGMAGKWFTVAIDPVTHAELAPRNLNVPFIANKVTIDDFGALPYPTLP